jgi:UMF1 family MFS transporter
MKPIMNDKKIVNSWAFFDWANSAYALVISTAIFPIYFTANTPEIVHILGLEFTNSSLYTFAVSFSYIIIAFMSPILSGIADYSGRKKYFLKIFTIVGSLACSALWFFDGVGTYWIGTLGFIVATIGFAGALVFYNAYLPEIATEDQYDLVSAKGFAYGYVGSVILLIIILFMISKHDMFGFPTEKTPIRIGFLLVGVWWLFFGFISFKGLPNDLNKEKQDNIVQKGYQEIKNVFAELQDRPNIKRFLASFFFCSAGVQTVIYVASIFAKDELAFESTELITIILLLQLVGIIGAFLFAYISKQTTNKTSLIISIVIWIIICVAAFFVSTKPQFYIIAATVGLVMGGIQSMSRSTYSKLLDEGEDDTTSYFSFYDVVYKLAIVLGTGSFAMVDYITRDMRYSILVLALYFVIGLLLLLITKIKRKEAIM